jgi:hypothetical protein
MTTHAMAALPLPRTLRIPGRQGAVALLAVAGGALVAAGALLPWFTLFAGLQGYAGVTGLYGRLLLGGGVLAAAGGVGLLFTHRPALKWMPGALGVVLLAFSLWLLSGLLQLHGQLLENPMLVARLGPGLFVSLGGAVVLAATLLLAYTLHSADPPPQDA